MTNTASTPATVSKPADMAPDELHAEAVRVVTDYLKHRGHDVRAEPFSDGRTEADLVFLDDGETVVTIIVPKAPSDANASPMPSLDLGCDGYAELRGLALTYAAEHEDCNAVRADVIAIDLYPERVGRIRHLVGAYRWAE